MARPSKYSPERAAVIISALEAGCTRTAAAARGEINRETLVEWCRRNPAFSDDCTRAESKAEARFTTVIARAAAGFDVIKTVVKKYKDATGNEVTETTTTTERQFDWRAALEILKRRYRVEWGDNVSIDLDREITELLAQLAGAGQAET